jgi:hypothetical protein
MFQALINISQTIPNNDTLILGTSRCRDWSTAAAVIESVLIGLTFKEVRVLQTVQDL